MLTHIPLCVLGSKNSSTDPIEAKSFLGNSGWVGEKRDDSDFFWPAGLFDDMVEHAANSPTA